MLLETWNLTIYKWHIDTHLTKVSKIYENSWAKHRNLKIPWFVIVNYNMILDISYLCEIIIM